MPSGDCKGYLRTVVSTKRVMPSGLCKGYLRLVSSAKGIDCKVVVDANNARKAFGECQGHLRLISTSKGHVRIVVTANAANDMS